MKKYKTGDRVILKHEPNPVLNEKFTPWNECGIVLNTWENESEEQSCNVAFFGDKFPVKNERTTAYIVEYRAISLEPESLEEVKYTCSMYYTKCPDGFCPNYPLEQLLDQFAESIGGEHVGAGKQMDTGERDVQWSFATKEAAEGFALALKNGYSWIDKVTDVEEMR